MSWWPFGSKAVASSSDGRAHTFAVDSVDPNLDRIALADPRDLWKSRGISQLEALDRDALDYVQAEPIHGLVAAAHLAYAEHRPLALAPEHVWLCVLQAMARVVEEQPEKFRALFVAHEGKETVRIQRDEFIPGNPDNDWGGAVRELGALVRARSSERAKTFLAPKGASEIGEIACEISLLGAMQNYFELEVHTLCGIPSITLEGTPAEWNDLRERTALLDELGLADWRRSLDLVLASVVDTVSGRVRSGFWREFYKREDASGGPHISGWINVLFPFLGEKGTTKNNLAHFGDHWPKHALEGVTVTSIPPGLSNAPFNWVIMNTPRPMSFVAGFTGVSQDSNGVVRPRIGWAVTDRAQWKRFSIEKSNTISGFPTLRARHGEKITDGHGIADEAKGLERWAVEFTFCATLTSLDGLQHAPGLASIGTLSTGLTSIEPLRDHATLERLWLQQDDALTDIRALPSLRALKKLSINHCNNLRDWSPLLSLEQLDELIIHGKTVPTACIGVHRGRDAVHSALSKLRQSLSA
ncbi:MAG: DUF4419 domain-containing protein [Polyangiales bacterium]